MRRSLALASLLFGMAATLPLNVLPESAVVDATTAMPGRIDAASVSGTSALTHTVPRPLSRNSGAPDITVIPSRADSSATIPEIGA